MKKVSDWNGKHIAISRTDSIGDVMLTLPICAWLKEHFPTCKITFICKKYTAVLIQNYQAVDSVFCIDEWLMLSENEQVKQIIDLQFDAVVHVFPNKLLARRMKKAKVPIRIGTSHRLFHLLTCNVRPNFTRKNADLHESQLNFELIRFFGLTAIPSMDEMSKYTSYFSCPDTNLPESISNNLKTKYIVLHPKSQGSALEWSIEKYVASANTLIEKGYQVVFTGTEKEGALFRHDLPNHQSCIDSTGKLSMEQLCVLIKQAQGLVACSTGPLHIAGYLGIKAVGLFSSRRPIHPGRWKPLGVNSIALEFNPNCVACQKQQKCHCIEEIAVTKVLNQLID